MASGWSKWDKPIESGSLTDYLELSIQDIKQSRLRSEWLWVTFKKKLYAQPGDTREALADMLTSDFYSHVDHMLANPLSSRLNLSEPVYSMNCRSIRQLRSTLAAWLLYQLCELEKTIEFLKKKHLTDQQRRCMVWSFIKHHLQVASGVECKDENSKAGTSRKRTLDEQTTEQLHKKEKATPVNSWHRKLASVSSRHDQAQEEQSEQQVSNAGSTPVVRQVLSSTELPMNARPAISSQSTAGQLCVGRNSPIVVQSRLPERSSMCIAEAGLDSQCGLHERTSGVEVEKLCPNPAAARSTTPREESISGANRQDEDHITAANSLQSEILRHEHTSDSDERERDGIPARTSSQQPITESETSATLPRSENSTSEQDDQAGIVDLHNALSAALQEASTRRERSKDAAEALAQAEEDKDAAALSLVRADHNVKILCGSISMGTLSDEPARLQARLTEYIQRANAARATNETEESDLRMAQEQVNRAEKEVVEADQKVDKLYQRVVRARKQREVDA